MSTYPEDIDKIATAIVRADYTASGDEPDYLMFKAIADALVAERERCMIIARDLPIALLTKTNDTDPVSIFAIGARAQARSIANAIIGGGAA